MSGEDASEVVFGAFAFRTASLELRRGAEPVKIGVHAARLLAFLVSRAGSVVSRDEIAAAVWPDGTHVDFEQGVNACVKQIRAALGDDVDAPRFIETLPRRGYRFIAHVSRPQKRRGRYVVIGASVACAALAMASLFALAARKPRSIVSETPMLAVLPFVDMTPATTVDGLADGLTEELITEMSRGYGKRVGVIARTSVMTFKGGSATATDIGRALGAQYVLEGSVRREGDRIRVVAQLVRAADHGHLWAGSYDRPLGELLALEREVGRTIARALAIELIPGVDPDSAAASTDPRAWESYLEAKQLLDARPPRLRQARDAIERALAADPSFARAWVALARATWNGSQGPEAREAAFVAVGRALALDDTLPSAHRLRANLLLYGAWDVEGARRELARAIELSPAYSEAWHDAAACAAIEGRHDEARRDVARAVELDPLSPAVLSDIGWYAYFARRWDEAVIGAERTLAVDPTEYWAQTVAVLALTEKGDVAAAASRALTNLRSRNADPRVIAALERSAPAATLRGYWRWESDRIREESLPYSSGPDLLAVVALESGDQAAALDSLERAAERHVGWMLPFLQVIPAFDPLHGDRRYETVVARVAVGTPRGQRD